MSNLYYIIGASGSGKDSIMNFARTQLDGARSIHFAHRYITRLPDAKTENHIYLTPNEFKSRIRANLFSMYWESHNQYYGIGKEINYWMYRGVNVIVNGSREYLPQAKAKYNNLKPVLITTSPYVLLQRLKERGRESDLEILERIERNNLFLTAEDNTIITIHNNGPLEDAGLEFLDIITKAYKLNPFLKQ